MIAANYTKIVAAIKTIARDFLRMKLISRRATKISGINNMIADTQKVIATYEKDIAQATYNLSKIDEANPAAPELKELNNANITHATNQKVELMKIIDGLNKDIAEQNDGIKNIETGVTKVNSDELNEVVDSLLTKVTENAAINVTAADVSATS